VLADDPIEGVAFDVLTRQDVLLVLSKSYPNAPLIMDRLEAIATTLNVSAMLRPVPSVDNKGAASR
jgi:hypothetical protein